MEIQHNILKIGVIGLGYVGLPLAVEFAKKYPVVGFDINDKRVSELLNGQDSTLEVETIVLDSVLSSELINAKPGFHPTIDVAKLADCTIYIVTVPTPTDKYNRPVLTPILKASETIGKLLSSGDIVIYESTVYPGVTEDECVPILAEQSGLTYNVDFFVGYSPERINPGDKEHTVVKILKVTSGSTPEVAETVDQLYRSIITAGTFKASSIKVAEAAKVIENSQRDINIAFVNELSKIFTLLNINTNDVLEAAGTKWNFLKFKPGLVGGHCISVDPYYLAQKAQEVGYHPEIILAGRRLNDEMGKYVANEVVRLMIKKDLKVRAASVLLLGFTFKENCPDVRNTKVVDIYNELRKYEINVIIVDPWADPKEVFKEYKLETTKLMPAKRFDAVILAVAHTEFKSLDLKAYARNHSVIYDVKGILNKKIVDGGL